MKAPVLMKSNPIVLAGRFIRTLSGIRSFTEVILTSPDILSSLLVRRSTLIPAPAAPASWTGTTPIPTRQPRRRRRAAFVEGVIASCHQSAHPNVLLDKESASMKATALSASVSADTRALPAISKQVMCFCVLSFSALLGSRV